MNIVESEKTKLIVVRHGESFANKQCTFAGHTDVDLTPLGKKQAELVCEFLTSGDFKIDKIYSSDLIRAYNTALPTSKKLGIEIETNENLREIYAGSWEGMDFEKIKNDYPKSFNTWFNDIANAKCDEGESVKQLYTRIKTEIEKIVFKNMGKTVLIVSHGTPIRIMSALWKRISLENIKDVPWVPNASVSVAAYDKDDISLLLYGFCDYLKGFETSLPADI